MCYHGYFDICITRRRRPYGQPVMPVTMVATLNKRKHIHHVHHAHLAHIDEYDHDNVHDMDDVSTIKLIKLIINVFLRIYTFKFHNNIHYIHDIYKKSGLPNL